MDAVEIALTVYQNDRKQLANLRRTREELVSQRRSINETLPRLDAEIDALRLKVRESRQSFVTAAVADD